MWKLVRDKFRLYSIAWLLLLLFVQTTSCQTRGKDISNSDDLKIKFQFPAKLGATKKFLISSKDVSPSIPAPTSYTLLNNGVFLIQTEIIDLGNPTLTVKVPVNSPSDFQKIRVLRLVNDDMEPRGYRWSDCTVAEDTIESRRPPAEKIAEN